MTRPRVLLLREPRRDADPRRRRGGTPGGYVARTGSRPSGPARTRGSRRRVSDDRGRSQAAGRVLRRAAQASTSRSTSPGTPFQPASGTPSADPLRRDAHVRRAARGIGRRSAARASARRTGATGLDRVPCHRVIGSDGALRGFGAGRRQGRAARFGPAPASAEHLKDDELVSRLKPGTLRPRRGALRTLPRPGRARWGVSGSLNPKSAPAGPNAVRGAASTGLGLRTRC